MPIPDYQTLMLPVLRAASNGEVWIKEVIDKIADELTLDIGERSQLIPSGKQTILQSRVHWAKTYLAQAGLVTNTKRGYFALTQRGKSVLASHRTRVDNEVLKQFEEFKQFRARSRGERLGEEAAPSQVDTSDRLEESATPDEQMRRAHTEINEALAQDLINRVRAASPEFFERLIVELLLSMGYGGTGGKEAGRILGRSGDDGVDGVIDQDSLGLDRVYIQAKRYTPGNNISSGAIREFFGSLDRHKANKGIFVTTSLFTPSAKETAEHLSKRIVLIDGNRLGKLMVKQNIGCRAEETFHLKNVDEEFFEI